MYKYSAKIYKHLGIGNNCEKEQYDMHSHGPLIVGNQNIYFLVIRESLVDLKLTENFSK
jgi:hypothetical protein